MRFLLLMPLTILITYNSLAQDLIQNYNEARDVYFWKKLYKDGGNTIYCDTEFTLANHSDLKLHVEHIYPASWIAAHFSCKNRNFCPVDAYEHAAADLHNLWPSVGKVNVDRNNLHFGEITGETARIREDICADFERLGKKNHGIVEPRDVVKGDIARTMFYMELVYGLPLGRMRTTYLKWDIGDPVDDEELRRNKEINKLQKRSNPFIGKIEDSKLVRLQPNAY